MGARRRALILSENAPVPADRRVWNESRTLAADGWDVSIVCANLGATPAPALERREGIAIHRFPLTSASGGAAGYAREYGTALWRMRALLRRLARAGRFDVVHACNPPDVLLLAARSLRAQGTRFVFDHHDLVPELYRSRFGAGTGPLYRAAVGMERVAFALADVSLATNESYRRIAIERGRMDPEDVFVVRNGPDLTRFRPVAPDPALRRGRAHLIAYLGVMGPQDGIDHAVRALAWLGTRRDDWHAIFAGDGDMLEPMRALARELGVGDRVEFAGWQGDDDIRRILSTADVCLAPDPPSPLNDVSTMIKVPEYMAMGKPIASYYLAESRVSAGPAALYADGDRPEALGGCVEALLEDPERRERMGRLGLERVAQHLSWQHSEAALRGAYERALRRPAPARVRSVRPEEAAAATRS